METDFELGAQGVQIAAELASCFEFTEASPI
jgi:hypothetical protein